MHRCCWRQINLVVNGALFTFLTLPLFSHMMRTLGTSTVVLAALLAFIWIALFAASVAVQQYRTPNKK